MILELALGAVVASVFIAATHFARVTKSGEQWILAIAQFVYYGGHPLLDDDKRFKHLVSAYRPVVVSFTLVILKLAAIAFAALLTLAAGILAIHFMLGAERAEILSIDYWKSSSKILLKWPFLVGTLLPLFGLPFLPKSARNEDYSALDKFLHYAFLGNTGLVKLQWWLERRLTSKVSDTKQNVYVSGLARSGSTALMQYLGQLPDFKSLSYQNMPFLFMPRLASTLIPRKKQREQERAHKDGMTHSLSTYEALEEPFWLHFAGVDFVADESLNRHEVDEATHANYSRFRALIAGDKTYLAKNNNHLLRAASIQRLDKQNGQRTRTIIPFREPVAQAKSLLQQHVTLSKLQQDNRFALDYMDFLVHHEFGLHLKAHSLGGGDVSTQNADPEDLAHWLEAWSRFYRDAFASFSSDPDACFFCYEDFLIDPKGSLMRLCPFLEISPSQFDSIEVKPWGKTKQVPEVNPNEESVELYNRLREAAINHEA
ncbi:MAG: sulfotransferase [Planctomycetota bacterium]